MTRQPFATLPAPTQAGILSNDPEFQRFAGQRSFGHPVQMTARAATEYLRTVCRVTSRRDLTTDTAAAARFAALQTDFDAWRGRVAQQR